MLKEAKAKFFDLQRLIEQKQNELNYLVGLRVDLVKQIEGLEQEALKPAECCDEALSDSEPITA